jgi:hypothetical protein
VIKKIKRLGDEESKGRCGSSVVVVHTSPEVGRDDVEDEQKETNQAAYCEKKAHGFNFFFKVEYLCKGSKFF